MHFLLDCVAGVLVGVTAVPGVSGAHSQEQIKSGGQAQEPTTKRPNDHLNLPVAYRNTEYGFCFHLPGGWKGYSIMVDAWRGFANAGLHGNVTIARGPIISIRHPQWTAENPRQDIPIMVFTRAQWRKLENDEFSVSAAPFGPSELGQNSRYVFALPPPFEYYFPSGWEEVIEIVKAKPLRTTCKERAGRR